MAERQTAARPYAEAAFRLAAERGELKAWSEMLGFAAAVAADAVMARLAFDPKIGRTRLTELFLEVCGKRLNAQAGNFIRLLVENRRLTLLPDIVTLYEALRAEAEKRLEATVVSAYPLEPAQMKAIEQALQRKFGRAIHLASQVDKSLLGGVVIRCQDLVIDGSATGRLRELASHLSH